jgi:hypothetical protein
MVRCFSCLLCQVCIRCTRLERVALVNMCFETWVSVAQPGRCRGCKGDCVWCALRQLGRVGLVGKSLLMGIRATHRSKQLVTAALLCGGDSFPVCVSAQ